MENGSPSRRRSWADKVEEELQSPRSQGACSQGSFLDVLLAHGPGGMCALSDSEGYTESEGEVPLPPSVREEEGGDGATGETASREATLSPAPSGGIHGRREAFPSGTTGVAAASTSSAAAASSLHSTALPSCAGLGGSRRGGLLSCTEPPLGVAVLAPALAQDGATRV